MVAIPHVEFSDWRLVQALPFRPMESNPALSEPRSLSTSIENDGADDASHRGNEDDDEREGTERAMADSDILSSQVGRTAIERAESVVEGISIALDAPSEEAKLVSERPSMAPNVPSGPALTV